MVAGRCVGEAGSVPLHPGTAIRFEPVTVGSIARGQAWIDARDFSLRRLGFQMRYRYELRPLSYLYVVYSRGGADFATNSDESLGNLFSSAFSLRDSEQFLVKFNYRFQR